MSEPVSNSLLLAVLTGASVASVFTGLDGDALLCAAAGATLYTFSAKEELPRWRRGMYLIVSVIVGYVGASDVVRLTPIRSTGVAAFLLSLLVVTVSLNLIERARSFDFSSLFNKGSDK